MNYINVILTFKVYQQFKEHPHLKITKCKKIINIKTGKILKYNTRGFYIAGRYIKRQELNNHIEKIPKTKLIF